MNASILLDFLISQKGEEVLYFFESDLFPPELMKEAILRGLQIIREHDSVSFGFGHSCGGGISECGWCFGVYEDFDWIPFGSGEGVGFTCGEGPQGFDSDPWEVPIIGADNEGDGVMYHEGNWGDYEDEEGGWKDIGYPLTRKPYYL